jgi:hypothetical protein
MLLIRRWLDFRSKSSHLSRRTDDHLNHMQPYTAGPPEYSTTSEDANPFSA